VEVLGSERERWRFHLYFFKKKIKLFIYVVFELELLDFSPKISNEIFVGIVVDDFNMLEMLT